MKRVILIVLVSVALAAGLAGAQSPNFRTSLPATDSVPTSQLSGTILNIAADKITIWDGNDNYIFVVDPSTTCGPGNVLSVSDLEAGEEVTVVYTWQRGPLPTAVHIDAEL